MASVRQVFTIPYLARHLARLLAALLLAGGVSVFAVAAPPPPLEQAFKASFITKFAPFVDWPAAAFATASSPLTICVGGHDDFGPVLDEVARGLKVRGHPLQVRRVGDSVPAGGCHMLVAGASSANLAAQVAGQPVLVITDRTMGGDGGMIRFVRQAGRIRFEIDNGAARGAHLVISSKLLGLAVAVTK